jgi:hypothetical protein
MGAYRASTKCAMDGFRESLARFRADRPPTSLTSVGRIPSRFWAMPAAPCGARRQPSFLPPGFSADRASGCWGTRGVETCRQMRSKRPVETWCVAVQNGEFTSERWSDIFALNTARSVSRMRRNAANCGVARKTRHVRVRAAFCRERHRYRRPSSFD